MLIVCPSCDASYDVPDAMAAPGRIVRCARCLREWKLDGQAASGAPLREPAPPEPEMRPSRIGLMAHAPVPAESGPAPVPPPDLAEESGPPPPGFYEDMTERPARRSLAAIAWIGSIVILACLLWAGHRYREDVMRAWPATERLYAALGWRAAPSP